MIPCSTLLARLHLLALQTYKRERKMVTPGIGESIEEAALLRIDTRSQTGSVCHRVLKACISFDLAISLLGIYPKEMI